MLPSLLASAHRTGLAALAPARGARRRGLPTTWMLLMGAFALAAGLGFWALRGDIGTYFGDVMNRLIGCVTTGGNRQ